LRVLRIRADVGEKSEGVGREKAGFLKLLRVRGVGDAGVDKKYQLAQDSNTHLKQGPVTCLMRFEVNFASCSEMWYLEVRLKWHPFTNKPCCQTSKF